MLASAYHFAVEVVMCPLRLGWPSIIYIYIISTLEKKGFKIILILNKLLSIIKQYFCKVARLSLLNITFKVFLKYHFQDIFKKGELYAYLGNLQTTGLKNFWSYPVKTLYIH